MKYCGKIVSAMLALALCIMLPGLSTAATLEERVTALEESGSSLPEWLGKIELSGLIEVEAGYADFDPDEGDSEDESDLVLATVELGIDVDFTKHVSGSVLLLWEEDDTEELLVDEGFIRLDGEDVLPAYLQAGKMYVPFGNFDSMFISDPLTLELGETRESAAVVGYANDIFDISVGFFNGDIDDNDDSHIDDLVASAVYAMPEGTVKGLELTAGVSWISNIADSDTLGDMVDVDELDDKVGGVAAFVTATLNERWTLIAEYLGALDEFEIGELKGEDDEFNTAEKYEPKTWNVELGCAVTDALEVAVRYEGGDDLAGLLPDSQYGIAATYGLFDNTTLAVEYLHGEFENDDEQDVLTAQLAYEF